VNLATGERTLIAKGQLTGRHVSASRRTGRTSCSGRTARSRPTTSTRTRRARWAARRRRASPTWKTTTRARAVLRRRRPRERRQGVIFTTATTCAAPARRLGALESDRRPRQQERDALPARPDRAGGPDVPRAVGPRGTFDLAKPLTLSAYGQWTKKAGFYELAGGKLKELVYEDASFSTPVKAMRPAGSCSRGRRSSSSRPARVGAGVRRLEEDHDANPQQKDSCGGTACCSTSRTRTACGCRASWRCPTTTSRARSGR